MGNCLPKLRRTNRVEPAPAEDIHATLSKATDFQKTNRNVPNDMAKALRQEVTEEEIPVPVPSTERPVAFNVEFEDEKAMPKALPKRLAERLNHDKESNSEIQYTTEEELLMAEILRDDTLKERQEKARNEDVKIFDAKRRRVVIERSREAQLEHKLRGSTPSTVDQKQKVKDLAEEDRRKAAERRRAAEKTE